MTETSVNYSVINSNVISQFFFHMHYFFSNIKINLRHQMGFQNILPNRHKYNCRVCYDKPHYAHKREDFYIRQYLKEIYI